MNLWRCYLERLYGVCVVEYFKDLTSDFKTYTKNLFSYYYKSVHFRLLKICSMLYVLVLYPSRSSMESGREIKQNQAKFIIYTKILNYRHLPHMSITNTFKVRMDIVIKVKL